MKYKYYIEVNINGEHAFVTGTGPHHVAFWNKNEPAKAFEKKVAEDIVEGLNLNMIPAYIVMAPDFFTFKNERDHRDDLLTGVVEWMVNDTTDLEYAKNELEEMGFSEDEMLKYGFPEETEEDED